jgi:hypothetical protein
MDSGSVTLDSIQGRNDKSAGIVVLPIATQPGKPESSKFNEFWMPDPSSRTRSGTGMTGKN